MGYRGIVIAGTGLGHVNKPLYPAIKRAIQKGVTVVMTVQTLWGFAQMYVYDTGRDLLDLGIIPMDNMLPETAYMKLAWVLGQTDDPQEIRADDDHADQPRDHASRAAQRLPDPPGRPARGGRLRAEALEVMAIRGQAFLPVKGRQNVCLSVNRDRVGRYLRRRHQIKTATAPLTSKAKLPGSGTSIVGT